MQTLLQKKGVKVIHTPGNLSNQQINHLMQTYAVFD